MEFNFIQFLFYLKLIVSLIALLFGLVVTLYTIGDILFEEGKFIFKKHIKSVVIFMSLFTLGAFLFSIEIIK